MDFKTFLNHFDTIAQAPNGIPKLRSLILNLAVRGKLVPQNPEDEPASVLLDKLQFEKDRLTQEGKIKGSKALPPINLANIPFAPPDGWEWVRLEGIVEVITKGSSPKWQGVNYVNSDSGILFITSENVRNYVLDVSEPKYVEAKFNEIEPRSILHRNDILMNIVGASIGRTAIYELDEIANINQAVCLIRLINSLPLLNHDYMLLFFNSEVCINFMLDKQVDNARANLSMGNIAKFPIPLPPLAEQKRIVEKVDELMALCDRLQQSQETRDTLRQKLRGSAIDSLMNAETDEELKQSWAIVRDNWHTLSQKPEDVGDLRRSVLQLAVRGKLTSPISNQIILEELLDQLKIERLSLQLSEQDKKKILAGFDESYEELTKSNSYPIIAARCICDFITKGTTPANSELLTQGEIPYIKVYNIVEQQLNFFYKPTYIPREVHETKLKRSKVLPGDVLMNIVGPPLGKVAVVPNDFPEWNLNQALAIFRPVPSINRKFLYYALSCHATLKTVLSETRGTAGQDNLSLEQCRDLQIPLFTGGDQERIVAKVDELMQMCDQLEESLRQNQQRVEALAASAISHLTI